jgi:hypothetical protein
MTRLSIDKLNALKRAFTEYYILQAGQNWCPPRAASGRLGMRLEIKECVKRSGKPKKIGCRRDFDFPIDLRGKKLKRS